MTVNTISFSFIPKDPMQHIITYMSSEKYVGCYATSEVEADRMILRLASVCKAWRGILSEERNRSTTRIRAYLAFLESTLLEKFPRSLVSVFSQHYNSISKLPLFVVDQRTSSAGSPLVDRRLGEVKHPVARYCLKTDEYPEGVHGLMLTIQAIYLNVEATLFIFKTASQGSVNYIAYQWKDDNLSIQNLYQDRHAFSHQGGHSRMLFSVRDCFGRLRTCCQTCPFTLYVQPRVIAALLNGQDPDFRLSGGDA